MDLVFGKDALSMVDSKMFTITYINKSIVATPAVGIYDGFRIDFSSDNSLQCAFAAVMDDFSVDASITKKDAENRLLEGAPTTFEFSIPTPHPPGAKITFIDLDFTNKLLEGCMLMDPNGLAKYSIPSVDCIAIQAQQMRGLNGCQIQTKGFDEFFNSILADLAVF